MDASKNVVHGYYAPKFHKRPPLTQSDVEGFPRFTFVEEDASHWTARAATGAAAIAVLALIAPIVAALRMSPRTLAA